jgi:hypothetical protein
VDLIDAARALNVALGAAALTWLAARTWGRRREYPFAVLLFLQCLGFYALGATYGAFEALLLHSDAVLRPFVTLVGHVTLLTCLGLTQRRRPIFSGER